MLYTLCSVVRRCACCTAQFENGVWVGVTVAFIVSEDASSAAVTSNLRLVGSVLGAMFAWFVTTLVENSGVSAPTVLVLPRIPASRVCAKFVALNLWRYM
jgi:Fusaric acid resistance protein-like